MLTTLCCLFFICLLLFYIVCVSLLFLVEKMLSQTNVSPSKETAMDTAEPGPSRSPNVRVQPNINPVSPNVTVRQRRPGSAASGKNKTVIPKPSVIPKPQGRVCISFHTIAS